MLPEKSSFNPYSNSREILRNRVLEQRGVADLNTERYMQVLLSFVAPEHMTEVIEAGAAANKSLTDMRWIVALTNAARELLPNDKETRIQLVLRAWDLKDEEERIADDRLRDIKNEETSGE